MTSVHWVIVLQKSQNALRLIFRYCTAVSRLIRALDTSKSRARLDRLVRDGKIERKREQGTRGPVYLFRRHS
jgi:hypothetical protein